MKRANKYCYTRGKVLKQRYPSVSVAFILTGNASPFLIPKVIYARPLTTLKINWGYQGRGVNISDSWKRTSCFEGRVFFFTKRLEIKRSWQIKSAWKPMTFIFSRADLCLSFCLLFPIWGRRGLSYFMFRIHFFLYDETTLWKDRIFWKHTGRVDQGDVCVQFWTK